MPSPPPAQIGAPFSEIDTPALIIDLDAFERNLDAMAAAASYTAAHPGSTILADEQSSSALLWLYPKTAGRVAFDARLEQYEPGRLRSWFTYITGGEPGWPALGARYDVLVASRKENSGLAARLERLKGWRIIAADKEGVAVYFELGTLVSAQRVLNSEIVEPECLLHFAQ